MRMGRGGSEKRCGKCGGCGKLFLGYLARNPTPNFVHPSYTLYFINFSGLSEQYCFAPQSTLMPRVVDFPHKIIGNGKIGGILVEIDEPIIEQKNEKNYLY
jgi:hypothetical protein